MHAEPQRPWRSASPRKLFARVPRWLNRFANTLRPPISKRSAFARRERTARPVVALHHALEASRPLDDGPGHVVPHGAGGTALRDAGDPLRAPPEVALHYAAAAAGRCARGPPAPQHSRALLLVAGAPSRGQCHSDALLHPYAPARRFPALAGSPG